MHTKNKVLLQLIFFILTIVLVSIIDLPGDSKFVRELQNTGHTFVFGLLALVSLWFVRTTEYFENNSSLYQYIAAFCVCLFAGVMAELLQSALNRDANFQDIIRDTAGIVAFLGFYSLLHDNTYSGLGRCKTKTIVMVAVASTAIMIMALVPLGKLAFAYIKRDQSFPVLVDFDSSWYQKFMSTNFTNLIVVSAPVGWGQEPGKLVAMVNMQQTEYPGIVFEELQPDWTDYDYLNFKMYSTNPDSFVLVVRVHDKKHNNNLNDRFNKRIDILQGENVARIPIETIRVAPKHRKINMEEIEELILFAVRPEKPVGFYLSNIWLD